MLNNSKNDRTFNPDKTCAFSGHRPGSLPWGANESDPRCQALKNRIKDAVKLAFDDGFTHFIFGAARGCDMYFFDAVISLGDELTDGSAGGIIIEAAIPFAGQCERWSRKDQSRYYEALSRCDKLTLLQHDYSPHCMARRNRYMTDNSSRLIAVFNGSRGGTAQTVHIARQLGLEVFLLPPEED